MPSNLNINQEQINNLCELQKEISKLKKKLEAEKEHSVQIQQVNIPNFQKINDNSQSLFLDLNSDNEIILDKFVQENESIKNLSEKTKRQLSLETQTKVNQGETKFLRVVEKQEYHSEPVRIDENNNQNRDWKKFVHLLLLD